MRKLGKEKYRAETDGGAGSNVPVPRVGLAADVGSLEGQAAFGITCGIKEARKRRFDDEDRVSVVRKKLGYLLDALPKGYALSLGFDVRSPLRKTAGLRLLTCESEIHRHCWLTGEFVDFVLLRKAESHRAASFGSGSLRE